MVARKAWKRGWQALTRIRCHGGDVVPHRTLARRGLELHCLGLAQLSGHSRLAGAGSSLHQIQSEIPPFDVLVGVGMLASRAYVFAHGSDPLA